MPNYWKIMPANSISNGYIYVEGLNTDPKAKPLAQVGDCQPGAFYFCEGKNIHNYLSYGTHARQVTLPEGEPVKINGDKLKAVHIICGPLMTKKELLQREPFGKLFSGSLNLCGYDLKDVTLPQEVGGWLNLRRCDLTGVTLPQKVGGSLDLGDCDLKSVTLPQKVGHWLNLKGCDLKGVTLPQKVGDWLDLSGCDLKGVTLPQNVGGSLYLTGCDLTGVTLPQKVGGKIFRN